MRRPLALAATALVAVFGTALLAPPALPVPPVTAALLATSDSILQLRAGQAALAAAIPGRAAGNARLSIAAMPYNQPALGLLVESEAAADPTHATNVAAALGWRDPLANARILELALKEGNPAIAAQRIDALGRTQAGEAAAPAADLLMAMPGGPEALSARAGNRSGGQWWVTYARLPARTDEARAGRLAFARLLSADQGPWRRYIVAAIIGSLEGEDSSEIGHALWGDTLADEDDFGAILYDETFARLKLDAAPVGGEWRLAPQSPFAVERVGEGVQLSRHSNAAGQVVAQRFPAKGGTFQLAVQGDGASDGLSWQIQCPGRGPVFASDAAIGGWDVIVPVDCGMATLSLGASAGSTDDEPVHLARVSLEPAS